MKYVFKIAILALLITVIAPYRAHATFPGKNIVFWDLVQSKEKKDPEFIKAHQLAREGKHLQALEILEQKIRELPKESTPHVMKGLILNEMGEYIKALSALNAGQMIHPRHPGLHYGFCEVYRHLGVPKLSMQGCRIAEEIHRHSPEPHYEYAQTLAAMGEMRLSNRSLATAAEIDPKNSRYHYERGMNFYYLNQYSEAEKSFQQALSIDPADVDSGYQLAYLYAAQKKSDLAKRQITQVLETRKEHPKLHSAKLLMEYVSKNALDKLPLEIIPHAYHVGRSKALYQSGQYGLALIEIEAADRIKPDDLKIKEVLIGLTSFLLRINSSEKAVKQMIAIVGETDPQAAKGYQELGDIEVLRGRLSEARKYYQKALSLSDPNGIARQSLDELPETAGPTTVALSPSDLFFQPTEALNRKGEIFAQYKMSQRAIGFYSLASRMNPSHLPSLLNTATAYYNSGDTGRAISILERLLISHPRHEDILTHRILLAQAYVKNGDHGKGLKNIEIAIELNPAIKQAIRENTVFEPIRKMEAYKKLVQ
jgi:tetratricopeptide (TPR) repeat protein